MLCLCRLSAFAQAHFAVYYRNYKYIQDGGRYQTSEDDYGERRLDLIARSIAVDSKRYQSQSRGQSRHHYGQQSVARTAHDAVVQPHTLVTQCVVPADKQHAVARGDTQ